MSAPGYRDYETRVAHRYLKWPFVTGLLLGMIIGMWMAIIAQHAVSVTP